MLLEGVFGRGGDLIPARGDTDLGNDTRVVTRVAYPFTEMCSEFSGSVCLQKSPPNTARFRERKIPGLLPQTLRGVAELPREEPATWAGCAPKEQPARLAVVTGPPAWARGPLTGGCEPEESERRDSTARSRAKGKTSHLFEKSTSKCDVLFVRGFAASLSFPDVT